MKLNMTETSCNKKNMDMELKCLHFTWLSHSLRWTVMDWCCPLESTINDSLRQFGVCCFICWNQKKMLREISITTCGQVLVDWSIQWKLEGTWTRFLDKSEPIYMKQVQLKNGSWNISSQEPLERVMKTQTMYTTEMNGLGSWELRAFWAPKFDDVLTLW